jgi:hypothetical protein
VECVNVSKERERIQQGADLEVGRVQNAKPVGFSLESDHSVHESAEGCIESNRLGMTQPEASFSVALVAGGIAGTVRPFGDSLP